MRTALLSLLLALAQPPGTPPSKENEPVRLPDGRSQTEEILKEEHKKSLRELDEIVKLAGEVKADLEKHDHHVVSVAALRKLDEIEKRTKRIRGRLRR
jgi:hypothetical protein